MLLTVHTSAHIYARTHDVPGSGYPGTVLHPYTDVIRAQIFSNVDIVRVQTLKGFGGFAIQLSGTWNWHGAVRGLDEWPRRRRTDHDTVGGRGREPPARRRAASGRVCVGMEFLSGVALRSRLHAGLSPAHSASLLPRKSHYSGNALHPETHLT